MTVWRYLAASLAFGLIGYWASEAMFWVFTPEGAGPLDLALTVIAYALASGAALSALMLTGARGLPALVLAGAIFGMLVEGVVVDTVMSAPPYTFVWTPIAWHMPLTTLASMAALRGRGAGRLIAAAVALLLTGVALAAYWPVERADLPGAGSILVYHAVTLVLALAGHLWLDRLGPLTPPPRAVLWVLPGLFLAAWALRAGLDPNPLRLGPLAIVAASVWGLRRLSAPGQVTLGHAGARSLVLAISALATAGAALAVIGTPGMDASWLWGITLSTLGLGLWHWALWRAWALGKAARAL